MLTAIAPEHAEALLKNLVIPPRPAILQALDRARQQDEPDFLEIGQLIGSDLALSAAVLKTVNSPLYRREQKIASIQHALQLLGLDNISTLAEGFALFHALKPGKNRQMEAFWESSHRIAIISAYLARAVHGISEDEAHTFALFHNCGQPLLAARFANYRETMQKGERMARNEFIAYENQRHAACHTVVGYLLARIWLLPETTALAILNHHDYSIFEEGGDADWQHACTLIALASLAEHIYKMFVKQFEHVEWRHIEPRLLRHLALEREEFEDMVDVVQDMLAEG
ncbi:HDOD domain-containing protein [Chitinilyticum litopenaei]|uniref:HDOD domain-containing protein n=1 Tax=Chitinilyticum litopenaei TaxID=1121276 RepID=UPI0003F52C33|nr:HDOD domain-containing protein [Chitinilyticum litopenaei]